MADTSTHEALRALLAEAHRAEAVMLRECGMGVLDKLVLEQARAVLAAADADRARNAAEADRLRAALDKWETTLSAVMPADYKDWHESDRAAWPDLAASCIVNARRMAEADGRLIEALKRDAAIAEAAPDMLACLDDIAKAWGTLPFTSPAGLKQRIDAARAKARGDDHE